MKRPSFQFYPGDWRANAKLRRCSEGARGSWMDIMCVLHDSDEYGVIRWPLEDLARAAGVPLKFAKELAAKNVLKGGNSNVPAFVYAPIHAGKEGETVTLIPASEGPCWYCSRFVRDEWVRQRRGQGTQFSADNQPPKPAPKSTPKVEPKTPIGVRQGDGPSSSSSSSSAEDTPSLRSGDRAGELALIDPKPSPAIPDLPKFLDRRKGTRWPADAIVPDDWLQAAGMRRAQDGSPPIDLAYEARRFVNYWASRSGAGATKLDWRLTWMNWATDKEKTNGRNGGKAPSAHDKFLAGGAAFLAKLDDADEGRPPGQSDRHQH